MEPNQNSDRATRTARRHDARAGAARFAEVRARFDQDAAGANDENGWKSLREAWLGRKSGVLTQVTDTWLKPAKPELKRAVGQALNELKAHIEAVLELRRVGRSKPRPIRRRSRASAKTFRFPA